MTRAQWLPATVGVMSLLACALAGSVTTSAAPASADVSVMGAPATNGSAGAVMRAAAAKRVKIKVVGGTDLTISVTPARPRKGSYLLVLEQRVSGKWRKVGRYRTIGKRERRTLDVRSGKYRVRVKAIAKSRGATKTFSYAETGSYARDYDWVYYFPAGYQPTGRSYPVIVAFSPGEADSPPGPYDTQLKGLADRFGFIVMSSRYYRNQATDPTIEAPPIRYPDQDQYAMNWGGDFSEPCLRQGVSSNYATARSQMINAFQKLPIDQSRVVLMGISGGASYSHALNIEYPGLAAAVVINTGMIWGTALPTGELSNGPTWNEYLDACRTSADYPQPTKQAWFLESAAGPGGPDFRYDEMRADANRYRALGWDVHELDFYGGHTMAPTSMYDSVFAELTRTLGWR